MSSTTPEQAAVFRHDIHMALTANAGSGKTTVLVEKYLDLLFNSPDEAVRLNPKSILAITFTRKAAQEMKKRVVEKIEKELQSLKDSAYIKRGRLKELQILRERLTYARIMTIHSFCLNVLKDHPIEAGLPALLRELPETERRKTMSRLVNEFTADLLNGMENEELTKHFTLLSEQMDIRSIMAALKSLMTQSEFLMSVSPEERPGPEEIAAILHGLFHEKLNGDIRAFAQKVTGRIEALATSDIYEGIKPENKEKLILAHKRLIGILNDATEDLAERNRSSATALAHMYELKFGASKLFVFLKNGGQKNTPHLMSADEEKELKEEYVSLMTDIKLIPESECDAGMLALSASITALSAELVRRFSEECLLKNSIDFDNMILKMNTLLQDDPEIAARVTDKLKHIMVDEFQDTNALQYSIIRKLVWQPGRNDIKLFIVGDPKQSIYGFRRADVRIFNKAKQEIVRRNRESGTADGDFKLTTCFRINPLNSAFVNEVCSEVMNGCESEYDIPYEALVCGRNTDLAESADNSRLSSVTFLLTDITATDKDTENTGSEDGEEDDSGGSASEASQVADHILASIGNTSYYKNSFRNGKVSREERKLGFGDIAILAKSRKNFGELMAALERKNIPCQLVGEKDFFSLPEIKDIKFFFRFIMDNCDDLALASVLKSPFFGLDDADLLNIAASFKDMSLWEKLERFSLTEAAGPRVIFAAGRIADIISDHIFFSFPLLIERITGITHWEILTGLKPDARQIRNNIARLKNYARDFEAAGLKSLADLVEDMELAELAGEAVQGMPDIDSGAVSIMTVHSSKGLEFPMVILFNTNNRSRGTSTQITDEEYGLIFKYKKFFGATPYKIPVATPAFRYIYGRQKSKEAAEEKRLLYVALTRACDHLVISGTYKYLGKGAGISKPASLLALILRALKLNIDSMTGQDAQRIERKTSLALYENGALKNTGYNYPLLVINRVESGGSLESRKPEALHKRLELFDVRWSRPSDMIFSPTRMLTFDKDRSIYGRRFVMGLPDADKPELEKFYDSEKDDDEVIGTEYGIVFHSVMEKISEWHTEGSILESRLDETIALKTAIYDDEKRHALSSKIREEILSVTGIPVLASLLQDAAELKTEVKMLVPAGDDILQGNIDLLIRTAAGEYEIWDWKTNKIHDEEFRAKAVANYTLQMQVYAYFIFLLDPGREKYTTRLIFTDRREEGDRCISTLSFSPEEIKRFVEDLERKLIRIKDFAAFGTL